VATAVGTHVGPWSDEDLLGLPEDAQRYELLEGTLLVNPLPGGVRQRISFRLTSLLDAAVLHDLVVVEAMGVRLPDNTVFIPDILVATRDVVLANDSGILDAGTVALVAEIVSPGSRTPDRITKPAVYASAGIDSFWGVEPEDGHSSPVLPRDTRGAACRRVPDLVHRIRSHEIVQEHCRGRAVQLQRTTGSLAEGFRGGRGLEDGQPLEGVPGLGRRAGRPGQGASRSAGRGSTRGRGVSGACHRSRHP
jgi:Uma2 family endonuclease